MRKFFWGLAVLLSSFQASAALVYTPSGFNPASARVLVVIHGCLQSAEAMALGTGWNQIADRNNLLVIYPQVPERSNPLSCWGWYSPENQKKESGQLRDLMTEIESVKKTYKVSSAPNFVTGISSGAATAAGLLACFPESFRAGAIHSGPTYGLVSSLAEGEALLKSGPAPGAKIRGPCRPRDFRGQLLVIQGTSDAVVHPSNAARIAEDFSGGSKPVRVEMIEGLGHAWAGFAETLRHKELLGPTAPVPTRLPFFSEKGPNAARLMWSFFEASAETPTKK